MTLTDHITRLFKAPETVDSLSDAIRTIELALTEARAQHAEARDRHAGRAIEFVGDTDAAEQSRLAVDRAARRVDDMQTALANANTRLAGLQRAQSARDAAQAWTHARSLLLARSERIQRVQALLDDLAREHAALLADTEAAWNALPTKPTSRPHTFTKADIESRVQLYLYGASGGQLGRGANAFVASRRPDLVQTAAEVNEMLLGLEQRTAPAAAAA